MKRVKQLILVLAALTLAALVIVGCGTKTASEPKKEDPKPAATQPAKATYVGSETCKGCHAETAKNMAMTKHNDAFKPLSAFQTTKPLGEITVFDMDNKEKPTKATLDLSKIKVHGVMVDDYIIAEVPESAGFKNKIYRVAAVHKNGDKWDLTFAKEDDFDKDGKKDWGATGYTCGACHSPGLAVGAKDLGVSCESCHGPGSNHVTAEKKTPGSYAVNSNSCMTCHPSKPSKNATTGALTAANHYGTRNYFASAHADSKQLNDCLACHTTHKANANGKLLSKDNPADICMTCHSDKKYDPAKLMWKNPTDTNNHFTIDHSFGAIKLEDMGDDSKTKETEYTNPKLIELIKKKFKDL
ncbi:MAG: cytochrome c3 family protein [Desulfitobacterium hafniense]|nr:cytochrome c3 family protein [Desulfitobacterium hafniense]